MAVNCRFDGATHLLTAHGVQFYVIFCDVDYAKIAGLPNEWDALEEDELAYARAQ